MLLAKMYISYLVYKKVLKQLYTFSEDVPQFYYALPRRTVFTFYATHTVQCSSKTVTKDVL